MKDKIRKRKRMRGEKVDNIVIFGASNVGLRIKHDFESEGIQVNCFCDNNEKKRACMLEGLSIISFQELIQKYKDGCVNAVVIAVKEPDCIVDQIRESRISIKTYGVTHEYMQEARSVFSSWKDCLFEIDVNKPRMYYFEYHVSYHCNLKCKGCGHYSNIAPEEFGDFDKFESDIYRLKELFWGIRMIRLMGGEPLLNPRLPDFCHMARKVFPDADIRIVSNGLLIPSINVEILKAMKENYIGFDITQYPPTSELKERIELRCLENEVLYTMSGKVNQFFRTLNINGDSNKKDEHSICGSRRCHFLENGKISVCGLPILNKKYKDIIGHNAPVFEQDIMDIYDNSLDGFAINDFLSKPIETCRYCDNEHAVWFEWCGNYTTLM